MHPAPFPFPRSIATVSLAGALPEKLDAAASVGFNGVELFENDLLTFDGTPAEVRRIGREVGLAITVFQPFRDFEAMPEPQRTRNLERAERKFDVMQALGTDLMLVCSNVHAAAIDDAARAAADLRTLAERAARRGLRVAYEALAWSRHVRRWSQAWEIVRQADHPALGLVLDSFHTLALGDDFAGIAALPAEKLFFVQLADAPLMKIDPLSWSRHFRNFPGQGDLDVVGFLRAVLACGYSGPLSLEVFNDEFRAAPARLTARDGLRSLILAEAEAGGRELPDPPVFDGVEFVEFAVDEASGDDLAVFLGHLGFRRAGRHRSKAGDLFRQGRINLLLNSEPDGAAHEPHGARTPKKAAIASWIGSAPYSEIGVLAPILLVILRLAQGFTASGEQAGANSLTLEHAPPRRRAYYPSFTLSGTQAGLILATAVFLPVLRLPEDQLLSWGWRIPFWLSVIVVAVGYIIRRTLGSVVGTRFQRQTVLRLSFNFPRTALRLRGNDDPEQRVIEKSQFFSFFRLRAFCQPRISHEFS